MPPILGFSIILVVALFYGFAFRKLMINVDMNVLILSRSQNSALQERELLLSSIRAGIMTLIFVTGVVCALVAYLSATMTSAMPA